jgi:membrane protease subunit HflK
VGGDVTSLDEWLKRSREKLRGGLPGGSGGSRRKWIVYGLIAFVVLWVLFTSIHPVPPASRGVVTTFGRYERTMNPGVGFTWPAPISRVEMVQVEEIREIPIPGGDRNRENLILTGDQNVIDLDYTVNWNIKNPQLYLFQLRDPEQTIREVAETSMRAVVSRVSLNDALGAGRGDIANRVQQNMQQLLDDYGSGIQITNISINQSQPPAAVNAAFLEVSAAQQKAQSAQNEARAYALQLTAQAQGAAAQFEQIYQQYRLSPEVTRRRMYYEMMEDILSRVETTIIEAPGVTPYLPLPEIQRRAQRPATPQAGQGQAR